MTAWPLASSRPAACWAPTVAAAHLVSVALSSLVRALLTDAPPRPGPAVAVPPVPPVEPVLPLEPLPVGGAPPGNPPMPLPAGGPAGSAPRVPPGRPIPPMPPASAGPADGTDPVCGVAAVFRA